MWQCLYDEEVTINPDGYFTIVTSLPSDKPSNVRDECGIGFLAWSEQDDGLSIVDGLANHENDTLIIMRNMLPSEGFNQAIQNTAIPGDDSGILGDFMPRVQYFSKQEFEALGCDAYKVL